MFHSLYIDEHTDLSYLRGAHYESSVILNIFKKGETKWPTVMDWIVWPWKSHGESLILDVTLVGDRAFKEVFKVKRSHKAGALIE